MSRTRPIFIRDIKQGPTTKRPRRKPIDVDAKKAYSFANEKSKKMEGYIETLAMISRKIGKMSLRCEALVLQSCPVRLTTRLMANTWPLRIATKFLEPLHKLLNAKGSSQN